jgi:hypothetical protein
MKAFHRFMKLEQQKLQKLEKAKLDLSSLQQIIENTKLDTIEHKKTIQTLNHYVPLFKQHIQGMQVVKKYLQQVKPKLSQVKQQAVKTVQKKLDELSSNSAWGVKSMETHIQELDNTLKANDMKGFQRLYKLLQADTKNQVKLTNDLHQLQQLIGKVDLDIEDSRMKSITNFC